MKIKSIFKCSSCNQQYTKWLGKCTACDSWNTIEEIEVKGKEKSTNVRSVLKKESALPLNKVVSTNVSRLLTGNNEFNTVLGGGIVPGALVLVGGEPGIGKSTLLIQVAIELNVGKVLYVSGEESKEQIQLRAKRIAPNIPDSVYIYTEINLASIIDEVKSQQPSLLIIDSIQTIYSPDVTSSPGSISQVKECTHELQQLAKAYNLPIFVVGHITKEGSIAGPKLLEHLVDVVLQFEGDRNGSYRIVRALKNRYGSTAEIGIFEMHGDGLKEVSNPSELFISQKDVPLSGNSIVCTIEGVRPILVEIQALVSTSVYGTPQRKSTGYDDRRLAMLLAVLEKRFQLPLANSDIFLNIVGGMKLQDPAADLAIISSIMSSFEDMPLSEKHCFIGEVGLSGEVRAASRVGLRIQEAEKLGFTKVFLSKFSLKGLDLDKISMQVCPVSTIQDLYEELFVD